MNDSRILRFPRAESAPALRQLRGETPLDRLERAGARSLSDAELLGLLLPGASGHRATVLARRLLERSGGLEALVSPDSKSSSENDLPSPYSRISSALGSLIKRLMTYRASKLPRLIDPKRIAAYLLSRSLPSLKNCPRGVLFLDCLHRPCRSLELSSSSLEDLDIKSLFRVGLDTRAAHLVVYQFRDDTLIPTGTDLHLARTLATTGEFLRLTLVDYLLLSPPDSFISLARRGTF